MGNILEITGKDKINPRARYLMTHSLLQERIELVENLNYKLYVHDSLGDASLKNVFTVILTANGNNIDYYKESIESVLQQTNENYELILVDHGCEFDLRSLIYSYFLTNNKIKLIIFEKNLYDPKETVLVEECVSNVLNSALFCSDGEYVYFLSYDDFLSLNYVDCMRQLFLQNTKCMVASPAVASINESSQLNIAKTEWLRLNNLRERYMCGIELAISVTLNGNLFAAPGGLCCYRSDIVLSTGGLDSLNDFSQIFKFSVLGEIGTCNQAYLYWRHHDNQTNKKNKKLGAIYYAIFASWIRHIEDFYLAKGINNDYKLIFRTYFAKKLHTQCVEGISDGIRSGWKGAVGVFFEIHRTAPKIYFFYFLVLLFIDSPYLLYNSLPGAVRVRYRNAKRVILRLGCSLNSAIRR
jgi:hypothetical protein